VSANDRHKYTDTGKQEQRWDVDQPEGRQYQPADDYCQRHPTPRPRAWRSVQPSERSPRVWSAFSLKRLDLHSGLVALHIY